MGFLRRSWSDSEKWAMGIVSALLIAAFAALIGGAGDEKRTPTNTALLLGYEGAYALAMTLQGASITKERALIDGYLNELGIQDIHYPADPAGDNGGVASQFAETVQGRLASRGSDVEAAFVLGWQGVISTNSRVEHRDFDMDNTASAANFPPRLDQQDIEYLQSLVDRARRS